LPHARWVSGGQFDADRVDSNRSAFGGLEHEGGWGAIVCVELRTVIMAVTAGLRPIRVDSGTVGAVPSFYYAVPGYVGSFRGPSRGGPE
jgi:hypothetical protein